MEAISAAATVVQLADFAGSVLQKSVKFLTAVAGASKELDGLHRKIQQVEAVFDNTRAVACSYQNSKLGTTVENQRTLELLGWALTSCSIDLQQLQDVVPKPLQQSTSSWIRTKRRVQSVLDNDRLVKLSTRLDGHIAFIGGLLSCLHISNDTTAQKSIEQITNIVNVLPAAAGDLAEFTSESRRAFMAMEGKLRGISHDIKNVDRTIAGGAALIDSRLNQLNMAAESLRLVDTRNERSLDRPSTNCELFLQALELLGPVARKAFAELYRAKQLPFSEGSVSWIMGELYNLLAMVHAAAAEAHKLRIQNSAMLPGIGIDDLTLPRRFRSNSLIEENPILLLSDVSESLAPAAHSGSGNRPLTSKYQYGDPTGDLFFAIEIVHPDDLAIAQATDRAHTFVRVSFCFIPAQKKCPGIAFASCGLRADCRDRYFSTITAFDVLPASAPILRDVQEGDLGKAMAFKRLKSGEAWAGDRDRNGRSLLSHAVESGSRDMVTLLSRMGADPHDVHSIEEWDFAKIPNQLAQI